MKKQQGSELFTAIVAAPFGAMGVRTEHGLLRELVYLPPYFLEKDAQDAVSAQACVQLARYFDDPDAPFDLPLAEIGSVYQQKVWAAIAQIPRGQVRTYGDIAEQLGSKGLARAVGQALGLNPFAPVVPCHRILAAGNKPGGFSAGGGTVTKLRMLQIEGAFPGGTLPLF